MDRMLELTAAVLEKALTGIGIIEGDGLLVHSSLQMLGRPEAGLQTYGNVILSLIGKTGTLVVPTFTLDYPKTLVFDKQQTPSTGMGSFSEHIRQYPGSLRSTHPLQSVAALGYHARDLTDRDTPSAFETHSVFERMLELDFKLLLLGADIQAASIVHYCEAKAEVPYRHWKDFTGRVNENGQWIQKTYRLFARILEIDPRLELHPIQKELESRRAWQEVEVNYGRIACCRLLDFVAATDYLLKQDPWMLVSNSLEAKARLDQIKG
jgi:aminoglycoside 3-N-acetyltransferase